jgi:hypothetical protein
MRLIRARTGEGREEHAPVLPIRRARHSEEAAL